MNSSSEPKSIFKKVECLSVCCWKSKPQEHCPHRRRIVFHPSRVAAAAGDAAIVVNGNGSVIGCRNSSYANAIVDETDERTNQCSVIGTQRPGNVVNNSRQ